MTNIGKILVVLVTVCAVLFMGFAVTIYATRTNWRDKYMALKKEKDELDAKRKGLEQQVTMLSTDMAAEVARHKNEVASNVNAIKDQKANYDRLQQDYTKAKERESEMTAALALTTQEAKDRREEAARIRELWKKTQEEKDAALKKQFETEQKFIELQGNYETLTARAKELEQRGAELTAILRSRGIPLESPDKEDLKIKNPPPVEGIVLEVDPQGKFVKISIGSDDGLRKLHRLEVYRMKPQGKYVGRIELIEVDPDKAVARILSDFKKDKIQVGDHVATRITASR